MSKLVYLCDACWRKLGEPDELAIGLIVTVPCALCGVAVGSPAHTLNRTYFAKCKAKAGEPGRAEHLREHRKHRDEQARSRAALRELSLRRPPGPR